MDILTYRKHRPRGPMYEKKLDKFSQLCLHIYIEKLVSARKCGDLYPRLRATCSMTLTNRQHDIYLWTSIVGYCTMLVSIRGPHNCQLIHINIFPYKISSINLTFGQCYAVHITYPQGVNKQKK